MQSTLPSNHVRPVPDVLRLYRLNPNKLQYSLSGISSGFPGVQIDSVDYTFRSDLTGFINERLFADPSNGARFYGTLRANNGVIRSTVIYNQNTANLFPKIFITSANLD